MFGLSFLVMSFIFKCDVRVTLSNTEFWKQILQVLHQSSYSLRKKKFKGAKVFLYFVDNET